MFLNLLYEEQKYSVSIEVENVGWIGEYNKIKDKLIPNGHRDYDNENYTSCVEINGSNGLPVLVSTVMLRMCFVTRERMSGGFINE